MNIWTVINLILYTVGILSGLGLLWYWIYSDYETPIIEGILSKVSLVATPMAIVSIITELIFYLLL